MKLSEVEEDIAFALDKFAKENRLPVHELLVVTLAMAGWAFFWAFLGILALCAVLVILPKLVMLVM